MNSSSKPSHENRLAQATSPYLLQHSTTRWTGGSGGPRRWRKPRAAIRPIMLSVGYAACHWCHVMAHESFEDEATARVMNELFVNIKVDREERPDIDQIYMNALHAAGRAWRLAADDVSHAGRRAGLGRHVFSERGRYGRPAFITILRAGRARLSRRAGAHRAKHRGAFARLGRQGAAAGKVTIGLKELDEAARASAAGVRSGRWRSTRRAEISQHADSGDCCGARAALGRRAFFETVEHSLERYVARAASTIISAAALRAIPSDERWLVPHFEKMLYDNAQLLEFLALALPAIRQRRYSPSARARR